MEKKVIFLFGPLSSVSQTCLSGSWTPALGLVPLQLLTMNILMCWGSWVIFTGAASPFCIAHPFPRPTRPTVANSKPPTHVKPLKTVSVGKTTAIAHWPSATPRRRQSEKPFERSQP